MSARVSALLPGLEGPATGAAAGAAEAVRALVGDLPLPGLRALLRAFRLSSRPVEAEGDGGDGLTVSRLGADLLGVAAAAGHLFPAAALSRAAFPDEASGGAGAAWLRADPVHLRADMGKLIVFPPEVMSLSLDQSSRIVEWLTAEEHFPGPPLELLTPGCWVCALDAVPDITSVSAREAYGANAQAVMVHGPDAATWHQRMNEIQMLLHRCPVNAEREAQGLAPVNSVWFWGEGALPEAPAATGPFDAVWADDPVIRGAANVCAVAAHPAPASGEHWCARLGGGRHLLALDALELPGRAQDPDAWRDALLALDGAWFEPLAAALDDGRVTGVDLYTGNRTVHARRARLWQRWRAAPDAAVILTRIRGGAGP